MKTYKAASTNQNKGYKTHGAFKNSGQKRGSGHVGKTGGSHMGLKRSKEVVGKHYDPVDAKISKISKAVVAGMGKTTNNDAAMRAQLNA